MRWGALEVLFIIIIIIIFLPLSLSLTLSSQVKREFIQNPNGGT